VEIKGDASRIYLPKVGRAAAMRFSYPAGSEKTAERN